jgi:hypothetical protein
MLYVNDIGHKFVKEFRWPPIQNTFIEQFKNQLL